MSLPGVAIRRPIAIIMIILSISLIGVVSLSKLKLDLLPDLNMPVAVVTARYEGAGPKEIERLITKPFEEALTTVSELKSIETVSTSEYCLCILYFNDNTDMNFATLEMREKIDLAKAYLPQGVEDIMVMRIDPNNFQSTFEIGITSEMEIESLTRIVEDHIINTLERISGVASAKLSGGIESEVRIELIPERLNLYGLSEYSISQYIMTENLNMPAGSIDSAGMSIYLKTIGQFKSLDELRNLSIPVNSGTIVSLKDIANISINQKERTSESFINGVRALNISVQKQSNANTVQVCRELKKEVKKLSEIYEELNFKIIYDSSTYIEQALNTVTESAIQGGLLAVLILYLFLRNIRAPSIIAVSMPVSIVASFVLMYFSGISLNLISLAGFALGVGMMVDNSIVVLENIYRHRRQGMEMVRAAELGAKEVMLSITASTLTTVIVFVPIIFVEGMTGKVFKEMGLVITFSLMASLLVAITFLPMMASKILSIEYGRKKSFLSKLFDLWDSFYSIVARKYEKLLRTSLNRCKTVIGIAIILFLLSLFSLAVVGFEYFPSMDEGIILIEAVLPKGSTLAEANEMAFIVQDFIKEIPEVQSISMTIGNSGYVFDRSTTEKAAISVDVGSVEKRSRTIAQISSDIRNKLKNIAGAKIKVNEESRVMGFSIGYSAVDIRVSGEDTDTLKKISSDLMEMLKNIKGIEEPESTIDEEVEEALIKIDRDKVLLYGLTTAQVGQAVRTGVNGIITTRYEYRGADIDVVICTFGNKPSSIEDLKNISIQSPRGVSIPLMELAEIQLERSVPNILRNDQKKTVSITADLKDKSINKVTADIDKLFSEYNFPSGYSYSYAGQQRDFIDSFDALLDALILSVIIVYMLLAAQFESFLHPFTILLTVPLALTGALLALLITGKTLSIPAFVGIIILVGIVVDNAIVLVDSINQSRKEGMSAKEAIIKSGPLRLRPILMTTLTTILGMLPMAMSGKEGSEIQIPLAIVIIGGLTVSTLITLIVIPSFYMAFENLIDKMKNQTAGDNTKRETAPPMS
ncbi:MAG: efflux RND transporter permease subunit [Clostridiaceae bacterium]|jgi:HAE1 family hydrophobic/amphiphilic exporter-1|nr:efflux RND transporter permease subunit [Clostridiaceae bacterium]